ncbi:phosphotransferase enzyme family protein [Paenibacillus thalictri]|uniref:Aminoglycoside phosphotransferase domain-containing protein n=1 Tax=Paenibacillus thalictri TaxID=2527873 RepID=A0A4Q9DEV5_9BACL|nr:phosphotransferase [Paenibacillus thalictri]TBL68323.1 hypothetical protein EYB31_38395 [Paenibacillus thalictri]
MKGYELNNMTDELVECWTSEIVLHIKERFGLSVRELAPIDMGWLNLKWKMETDHGPLFVKYYHPDRYKLHVRPERRKAVERTLQLQHELSKAEIPCPSVYSYNGQYIQETPSGLFYAVLDWVDGYTAQAGTLKTAQMFELGAATGKMHKWLQNVPLLDKPAWRPLKDVYLQEWQANWNKAQEVGDHIVMSWLDRSHSIVESMDFGIFESCQPGWLHWDLWVDNILLNEQGLSGIVDFDRMAVVYQEVDVARAVLTGALRDGQIQIEATRALMDGYRGYSGASNGALSRAMKMLYLIESIWWLRTEVREKSELRGLLGRFVEEMHWIENNWATLSEQLDAI